MKRETISHKLRRPAPMEGDEDLPSRPANRAECRGGVRPCRFVSCKWNLYLDVKTNGSIVINFPDIDPDEMSESCCLDIAERGPQKLRVIAAAINVDKSRIAQILSDAAMKWPTRFGR